ncbi:MAG: SCP2 sterol-binding domain-containing protein [Firmicutes bacterium]|nr:SCP2 sterol-binding domain-containing protein [Bacillota bacterium]
MATVQDVLEGLRERVARPEAMEGVTAVYQFVLEGEGGGNYVLRFQDGAGTIEEGTAEDPNVTITMDAADFVDMISGNLNAMVAFMGGKLRLQGDMALAMKLQSITG